MSKNNVSFSRRNGRLQCDVHGVPGWEGLEKLALFLEKHYGASVLERIDGPDARRWVMEIAKTRLELQHEDPWGNIVLALDERGDDVVRRIGEDLGTRLAGIGANG